MYSLNIFADGLMRLIDADALYEAFERTPWRDNADRDIAEDLLDNAPTVSPWVKTSDRLPTEADADGDGKVTVIVTGPITGRLLSLSIHYKSVTADSAHYFLPLPKLPDFEG